MLKYMEYVYAVHLNRSFSKAAEDLYISQPALSAAIKKVEEEIGLSLFDRSTSPIQLTAAGEYYIQAIEKIMEQEREMRAFFDDLIENKQTSIKIGGASFFCTYVIPAVIQRFRKYHPEYTISILEGNMEDLIKNLRLGAIDIIIDVEKEEELKHFDAVFWEKEEVLLAVPAASEINDRLEAYRIGFEKVASGDYLMDKYPRVSLEAFKDEKMLFLKQGNDMYQRALKMCERAGFTPDITMYLDQMLTSYQLAKSGKGVAFIRGGITNFVEETDRLFFYKIDDANSYQNIMLYTRKSAALSAATKDFIDFIKQYNFSVLKPVDVE